MNEIHFSKNKLIYDGRLLIIFALSRQKRIQLKK